jgi:hypothetical protein
MTNGSERIPEGVRIPRTSPPADYIPERRMCENPAQIRIDDIRADHALNDEQDEYAAHRRVQGLIDRLHEHGIHATERHQGVLLTEDAARAVLARLEEGK